jgi:hypothetical protein
MGVQTVFSGHLERIVGSGMENPDLPPPPIYRCIFHVPIKAAVNRGFTVTAIWPNGQKIVVIGSPSLIYS